LGAYEKDSIRPIETKQLMHYNVDELGRECECGKMGCLLRYASPDGLIQTAQEKVEFYSGPTQLSLETPGELKFKKLVTYTKKGDPLAIELLNQTIALLLPAFRETVKSEKPERVIISGRMGQFGKLISKPLQATLSEMNGKTTPVLTPFSKSYEEVFIGLEY
jgi:glucokinase